MVPICKVLNAKNSTARHPYSFIEATDLSDLQVERNNVAILYMLLLNKSQVDKV